MFAHSDALAGVITSKPAFSALDLLFEFSIRNIVDIFDDILKFAEQQERKD
mgnify:CR=1 FL=1